MARKRNGKNGNENGNGNIVPRKKREPEQQVKTFRINPKSTRQTEALKIIKDKENQFIFLLGPAGSGKTHLATLQSIRLFLNEEYDKLILTRPVIEAGEHLGYLPGTCEEKIQPYMAPLFDHLRAIFSGEKLRELIEDKKIEIIPLAYMRGRSFHKSIIVADEIQNATNEQIKMLLTRIGSGSKIILTADPSQSDLDKRNKIEKISEDLSEYEGISRVVFEEEDIVRNPLIGIILKTFEKIYGLV